MSHKLLFENNFVEETKIEEAQALLEAEPNYGSDSTSDVSQTINKSGFAKATLSKTLPALVGYIQELNAPVGYIFGFRPKGTSGSTNNNNGLHVTNPNDVDVIETQGDVNTTITVQNPISNKTSEDFMVTRKKVETSLREVKVDMTNEVEQDVLALFGGHFKEKFYKFNNPGETNSKDKAATFFAEFAKTQMVKKTNTEFVNYLNSVARDIGAAAAIDSTDKLAFALGEMQGRLYGDNRKKVSGRTWIIAHPGVAATIGQAAVTFSGNDATVDSREPSPSENTFVTAIGSIDVYSSVDLQEGEVIMGITSNANNSSIYYNPYNEYMINSGPDPYTGISNIFFRVRDAWCTNPLDTFGDTQPTPTTGNDNGYPELKVVETANSDYVIKGTLTLPTMFV